MDWDPIDEETHNFLYSDVSQNPDTYQIHISILKLWLEHLSNI